MKKNVHIFNTPEELAIQFTNQFISLIENDPGEIFHVAISGGKTPDILFAALAKNYSESAVWQKVHFWWVDERMVEPDHPESNFGRANKLLFSKISIAAGNIHRIKGENDPEEEARSYSKKIQRYLPNNYGWPIFDLILLGMGDDGHTASIFPNQMSLLDADQICEVATHPDSGQKRVTLIGKAINNATNIFFLITGTTKADRIFEIFTNQKQG